MDNEFFRCEGATSLLETGTKMNGENKRLLKLLYFVPATIHQTTKQIRSEDFWQSQSLLELKNKVGVSEKIVENISNCKSGF